MSETRHPVVADTSSLVAIATSDHWETARENLTITTTNICQTELKRHQRENHQYAPDGSREHRLHHGSKRVLQALDDDECAFSVVTVVGVPGGEDAGERSLETELTTNPDAYRFLTLNDVQARDRIRRTIDREDLDLRIVPPTFLLYVLFDNELLNRQEFCEGCAEMMRSEGWTNVGAVHAMWEGIPVDCSGYVDESLLPP